MPRGVRVVFKRLLFGSQGGGGVDARRPCGRHQRRDQGNDGHGGSGSRERERIKRRDLEEQALRYACEHHRPRQPDRQPNENGHRNVTDDERQDVIPSRAGARANQQL